MNGSTFWMIKYIVYEWVRFFKGQVYEWGRFRNTGSHTRTKITPKLPPPTPPPYSSKLWKRTDQDSFLWNLIKIQSVVKEIVYGGKHRCLTDKMWSQELTLSLCGRWARKPLKRRRRLELLLNILTVFSPSPHSPVWSLFPHLQLPSVLSLFPHSLVNLIAILVSSLSPNSLVYLVTILVWWLSGLLPWLAPLVEHLTCKQGSQIQVLLRVHSLVYLSFSRLSPHLPDYFVAVKVNHKEKVCPCRTQTRESYLQGNWDSSTTRQFPDTVFWRQFSDRLEDSSPTRFLETVPQHFCSVKWPVTDNYNFITSNYGSTDVFKDSSPTDVLYCIYTPDTKA